MGLWPWEGPDPVGKSGYIKGHGSLTREGQWEHGDSAAGRLREGFPEETLEFLRYRN